MFPRKGFFISFLVALTITLQLALPAVARADDANPPTDPANPGMVDPAAPATPTVPEILDQAPAGTEVVVINPDGSTESLATQAAAEAIATSDPVWCPAGALLGPADPSCTPSFPSIGDPGGLIAYLFIHAGTYSGAGTIFFTTDYNTDDVYLDGGNPGLAALTDLSITGDTGGGTAANLIVPIFVSNWRHAVQINNINIDLPAYPTASMGVDVSTTGAISLSNVNVSGAESDGAYLNNSSGSGSVTVTHSDFSWNAGTGLEVNTTGTINLSGVTARYTTNGTGAVLNADDSIEVAGSTFSSNNYTGLWAGTSAGDVNLTNVTASNNQYGAIVGTDLGNVQVSDSTFDNNNTLDPELDGYGTGLQAATWEGNVALTAVTADGNDVGASVGSGAGDVTIATGEFNDNTYMGLEAGTKQGTVTLNHVVANNTLGIPVDPPTFSLAEVVDPSIVAPSQQAIGAHLGNLEGPIVVNGGTFDGNTEKGLFIQSTGLAASDPDVHLNAVEASWNGWKGAYVEYYAPCGTASGGVDLLVDAGDYENNGSYGIYGKIGPDGILTVGTIPTLGNNGGDAINDIVMDRSIYPCPPPETSEPKPEAKTYHIVEVTATGGTPIDQDCANYAGTVLILPSQDKVTLNCPASGSLNLLTAPQGNLPGAIPQGVSFLSAMQFDLLIDGQPVKLLPVGGSLTLAFKLAEDANPHDNYAILYWDSASGNGAGGWVELPKFSTHLDGSPLVFALHPQADPVDGMRILSGTRLLANYVKATVNFPGVFVLIKK